MNDTETDDIDMPQPFGAQVLGSMLNHIKELREIYAKPLAALEHKRVAQHLRNWLTALDQLGEETLELAAAEYSGDKQESEDQGESPDKIAGSAENAGEDEDVEESPGPAEGDLAQPSGEDVSAGLSLPGKASPQPPADNEDDLRAETKSLLDRQQIDLQQLTGQVADLTERMEGDHVSN
jgi:hypothetical protein